MSGFFEAIAANSSRKPLLAAWVIGGECAGSKALFAWEGSHYSAVCRDAAFPAACAEFIQYQPRGQSGIVSCAGARLFLEPVARGRKLVICGAGHVAMPVIQIGAMLNFDVTAIDDREAFIENARAAGANNVICRPFDEALDAIVSDASTAFVIMTREHAHDVECLRRILRKPRAYAGMMGSRSRTEKIRELLLSEGFDPDAVAGVHMPIGLPIGSRTPAEIAVSVMAEVITVMNAADTGEGWPPGLLEALTAPDRAPSILAMIVEKRGEAPRRPGTKLLVKSDGRFFGTVGGGTAEAVILKQAGDMLHDGCHECRLVNIALQKGTMHCGGEIEVFLLPLK